MFAVLSLSCLVLSSLSIWGLLFDHRFSISLSTHSFWTPLSMCISLLPSLRTFALRVPPTVSLSFLVEVALLYLLS